MAKRSSWKGSRRERKAERERAQDRRERGLPELPERKPLRARAATPEPSSVAGEDRSSDAPTASKSGGVPPFVWVVGAALVILVIAYFVSQRRDEALTETPPQPEVPSASAVVAPEQPATEPSAAQRLTAVPAPVSPVPSVPVAPNAPAQPADNP